MAWTNGLFVHWPFDPEQVRPHVPDPLELDVRDGRAWISVLPFVLSRAGLRYSPAFARLTVPELNVRTYVRFDGAPGLYFLDIDLGNRLVARLVRDLTGLPVHGAEAGVRVDGDRVDFRSVRDADPTARFDASFGPDGDPYRAEPGSLDHWLAERRRMYATAGPGVLYGEIAHEPWPLQPADATIAENTLFEAGGLPEPAREPRVRYAGEMSMTGSVLRRVRP